MGSSLSFFTFMYLSFLLFSFQLTYSRQSVCHDKEHSALLRFKESLFIHHEYYYSNSACSTKTELWNLEGNGDCCSWEGVKCNMDTGYVIKLDLSSSCLYGSINSTSTLFHLVHLQWLSLAYNNFTDSKIPSGIMNLSRLSHLNLSHSYFSGQIPPEILELSNLESLDLSGYWSSDLLRYELQLQQPGYGLQLQQPDLQSLVQKLTNLKVLDLSSVHNISSSQLEVLTNLASLNFLSLQNCNLEGTIPSSLGNLSNLIHLDLSYNNFWGQIPLEMLELSQLEYLDLSRNTLQLRQPGGLRSLVDKLTNLKWLDLDMVNISSPLPDSLGNLSSLTHLSLGDCKLQGTIPSSLGNLSNLIHLDLSYNYFGGQIPLEMLELSQLEYLDLSYNWDSSLGMPSLQLRQPGGLRSLVDKLTNLKWLDLDWVNISSPLPDILGNLSSLTYLSLMDCQLQGTIPSSIGSLTKLVHLEVGDNNFRGELPISLGNLTQLDYLRLSSNNFSSGNSFSWSWIAKQTKLTQLRLTNLNLAGEIPFWLLNLTHLSSLNMESNQLTGPIPFWLMNLNQLSSLDFSSNQLTGQIPSEISNLTQLTKLDLSSNRLQGPIPSSIFELKNLQNLVLYSNRLNGTVELDTYLLKFKSLDVLILTSNHFSVLTKNTVNTTIHKLSFLGLGSCNLTGFPNFLQNLDELEVLDLSSNNITGQIPSWLLNISKDGLKSLNLSYNLLTGFDHHPVVLPWTNLLTLDLRSNKLQGSLPLPASSTQFYLASNNKLTGEISPQICKLNRLYALDLSYNNLSGVLPQCLGNFSNYLSILGLQSNDFSGSIPQLFMSESSLRMIDLSHNTLQGKIPRSLANCTSLEFLNLGFNQIIDTFPSWLGILPELKVVILASNKFHGVLSQPKTNFKFSKLQIIDLSHNLFTGELPSEFFQCLNSMKVVNGSQLSYMEDRLIPSSVSIVADFGSYAYAFKMNNKGIQLAYGKISNQLTGISFSGNKFTGEIPTSISNLKALKILNLSNNNFFGCIPSSLGNLTELESLDLSNNKLFGEIPHQLAELDSLEVINVSHNNLKGRIPEGRHFETFENISFVGNPGLCGKPLSKKCEPTEDLKKGDQGSSAESKFAFDWKIVLIGFVSGLVVGVILGNEFFTNITEWFEMTFGMQLMRVKRRRGHRN